MTRKLPADPAAPMTTGRSAPDDPYLILLQENWPKILTWYRLFEAQKPVMLYNVQEGRIYTYLYAEFMAGLNPKSQASLAKQYQAALRQNQMVVFVRDSEKRQFKSYSLSIES